MGRVTRATYKAIFWGRQGRMASVQKWFKERHMGLGDMMDVPMGLPAKVHILPDTHLCTNQDEWLIFAPCCSYFSFLVSLFKKMSQRTTPGRVWRANSILGMAASDVVVWKRHHLSSQSPAVGRLGCLPPDVLFLFFIFPSYYK